MSEIIFRYIRTQGHMQKDHIGQTNDQRNTVHVSKRLPTISETPTTRAKLAERQKDQTEKGLTRSELDLIERSHSDLKRYENTIPCRSLSDIKSALEPKYHSPGHQKSLSCLNQVDETQRKQIEIEICEMKRQEEDQYFATGFPQGIQTSLILEGPVTTVHTPSTSQLDLTPSSSSNSKPSTDSVNTDFNVLNLAKNITVEDEGDFELQGNERSHLLKDTNAVISVTEGKVSFRN